MISFIVLCSLTFDNSFVIYCVFHSLRYSLNVSPMDAMAFKDFIFLQVDLAA
jgi:hypothetical protein